MRFESLAGKREENLEVSRSEALTVNRHDLRCHFPGMVLLVLMQMLSLTFSL